MDTSSIINFVEIVNKWDTIGTIILYIICFVIIYIAIVQAL